MKLLMAVLTLSMPMLQSEMCADTIKVVTNRKGDSLKGQYPHLTPGHFSPLASAEWDEDTGNLSIIFNTESDEVRICIYKDNTLIIEDILSVMEGDMVSYNLSTYGAGDYQIVITGLGEDILYGNF